MADLYQGKDPRCLPAYTLREAAHYLYVPVATLRSWVMGRMYPVSVGQRYFEPLITVPEDTSRMLSFTNLVEAHVLAAIRRNHNVTLRQDLPQRTTRKARLQPLSRVIEADSGIRSTFSVS